MTAWDWIPHPEPMRCGYMMLPVVVLLAARAAPRCPSRVLLSPTAWPQLPGALLALPRAGSRWPPVSAACSWGVTGTGLRSPEDESDVAAKGEEVATDVGEPLGGRKVWMKRQRAPYGQAPLSENVRHSCMAQHVIMYS